MGKMNLEFKIGTMFKMPTGEVLKIKKLDDENGFFEARLFGLKGQWTDYAVEGPQDNLHLFFTDGGAVFVNELDYPPEPVKDQLEAEGE